MGKSAKFVWVFFALFAGLSLLGSSLIKLSAQNVQQQHDKKSELPTLDYETEVSKAVGADRRKTSARFSGHGNPDSTKPIAELPNGVVPLPTNVHLWIGLSALPVA